MSFANGPSPKFLAIARARYPHLSNDSIVARARQLQFAANQASAATATETAERAFERRADSNALIDPLNKGGSTDTVDGVRAARRDSMDPEISDLYWLATQRFTLSDVERLQYVRLYVHQRQLSNNR